MIAQGPTKELLLESVQPLIRNIAIYYARKSKLPAEDLQQEAVLRIWRRLELFDPAKSCLKTWATREASGAMLDYMRSSYFLSGGTRKHRTEQIVSLSAMCHRDKQEDFQPEDKRPTYWHFGPVVLHLLRRCTEQEKAVIVMYYHDGLTMKQIGEHFGITDKRIAQIHERVIQRLRATTLAA